jgi:hypothetical protein
VTSAHPPAMTPPRGPRVRRCIASNAATLPTASASVRSQTHHHSVPSGHCARWFAPTGGAQVRPGSYRVTHILILTFHGLGMHTAFGEQTWALTPQRSGSIVVMHDAGCVPAHRARRKAASGANLVGSQVRLSISR